MKSIAYLLVGVFFGIVLIKSEAASWFRIYEMFQFQSFHMYGIMGSALILGMFFTQWVKRARPKAVFGGAIVLPHKDRSLVRYLVGGMLFGLGWALAGACPGPIYALVGAGFWPIWLVLLSSILGALAYGMLRPKLPH